MRARRQEEERLTWQDAMSALVVMAAFMGLLYLFADALDADAAFTAARLSEHQTMVIEAQQEARLAEVTR